ncbi:hypothetical protein IFM46972_03878 [Aspergillus udagawae]|uniref:Uncharacterized protein n=1 Tax=Aspergillus udagawae TaxID=91492 RepID=A0A8H3NGH3_9EURO|nr:hypothetical protein IFM46972_03878 [Aspergillus udagawae]
MQKAWLEARNNHTYENGLRYHGCKGEFPFPDDKAAQESHSALNYLWRMVLDGKLFVAPLPTPLKRNHKVLDFATRSAEWIGDFHDSDEHAGARLTAMDPTYMQRTDWTWLVHHDLEGDWPFSAKQAFHLIHAQSLGGLLVDWEGFYQNAYKHLVPGGWLEVKEHDIRLCSDDGDSDVPDAVRQWRELLEEAAEKFGKRINVAGKQQEWMERAGFVEVREQVFKVPLGEWSEDPKWKRVGGTYSYQLLKSLEVYSMRLFTRTLGWLKEDTDALLARVREQLQQENLRLYSYFRVVTGQKPTSAKRTVH